MLITLVYINWHLHVSLLTNTQSCSFQRLRHKASTDGTMTLDAFLDEARALDVSEKQPKDIEPLESANSVLPQPPETPQKKRSCYECSESWPYDQKKG